MTPGSALNQGSALRVLVTGSRGKSSTVRFLHAALSAAGLQTFARITGVEPREYGPDGVQTISRSSGAHVEEMRWWLRKLPVSAQAVVLENSAISPDFQALAGKWLRPHVTILTNTVPDHQEAWGPTSACAADVLTGGIPAGGQLILPAGLEADKYLLNLLTRRRCRFEFAEAAQAAGEKHLAINLGLAIAAARRLGLEPEPALQAMLGAQGDKYDFRVVNCGGAEVAMAFSANDVASTRSLFRSLSWSPHETRLVYNHRRDRPGRFRSFIDWLSSTPWQELLIIGDRPPVRLGSACYMKVKNKEGLLGLFHPGDRIFGCGNIAGLPMTLAKTLSR